MPLKLKMPEGTAAVNSHGLEVDAAGNIYLTYEPDHTNDTHCLVRWKPDGTGGEILGAGGPLCVGTPHGLRLAVEGDETFLYHANNGELLTKTTLEGDVVWQVRGPPNNDSKFEPYKPTWFAVPPEGDYVYLADGYGSNLIHVFTRDGAYANHTFGGGGSGDGQFATCHSITYDARRGQLVVSDRENHRLQRFSFDAKTGGVFDFEDLARVEGIDRICNIRSYPALGGLAILPALEGPVAIVDAEDETLAILNVSGLLGAEGHLHPHDAQILPNGDVVVATWAPGRVSYWKKLAGAACAAKGDECAQSADCCPELTCQPDSATGKSECWRNHE